MKKRNTRILFVVFLCALLLPALLGCNLFRGPGAPGAGGDQVLNLYNIDPITLDPAISGEGTSHQYITQIFGGLVRLDDDLNPVPDIAQEWQVSDNGRTYTFTLRKDATFHDGRSVKAQDFQYSWQRAADPATGSLTAGTYLGDIVGVKDMLAGKSKQISGIKVIDDFTLQVTIDSPKSYFLSVLTYPTSFVVDRNNVAQGRDWWRKPNGTGPFKLIRWDKGSQLVLERNELYHNRPAVLKQVVFSLLSGVPMNLYETGKIDITGVGSGYIDSVTDRAGPYYQQMSVNPELSFFYIGFDVTRPPFDDINVRRAFSMAVDKEKIIALVYRDMVQRADGILPPGMPGFNNSLAGLKFDPARARELIAASRYGGIAGLPPIIITTSGWGGLISGQLEATVQQWRENLGVEVQVRQLEPERSLYVLKQERDNMFDSGWVADYPHPNDFLDVLFRTGADYNYGDYSNAEYDALLDRARTEPDKERSLALYRQAEQLLVDDAAAIPFFFGRNYLLVKPYVKGYKPNALGYPDLTMVTVEPH